jgi:hypothetical protein
MRSSARMRMSSLASSSSLPTCAPPSQPTRVHNDRPNTPLAPSHAHSHAHPRAVLGIGPALCGAASRLRAERAAWLRCAQEASKRAQAEAEALAVTQAELSKTE